jgi:hypothetical protein
VVATALADVPSPGPPAVGVHVVFAALLLAVVVGLVGPAAEPAPAPPWTAALVATALIAGWLVLAPGSWTWAVGSRDLLDAWDLAAGVAAAAGLAAGVALAAAAARRDRSTVGVAR